MTKNRKKKSKAKFTRNPSPPTPPSAVISFDSETVDNDKTIDMLLNELDKS